MINIINKCPICNLDIKFYKINLLNGDSELSEVEFRDNHIFCKRLVERKNKLEIEIKDKKKKLLELEYKIFLLGKN
jgi:hypothetical protein